jgi:hypothetical protein
MLEANMSSFFDLTSVDCRLFSKIWTFVMSSFLDKKGFLHAVPLYQWGNLVSVSDEEPYSTIFASLKHPIRRRILRMLSKKPMSFTEMLRFWECPALFSRTTLKTSENW